MTLPALGWVDWALVAALALSVTVGLWRGLVFEVLSLVGWVAAYLAAQVFASTAAPMLPIGTPGGGLNYGAAFSLIFVVASLAWVLASRSLRMVIHATPLQLVDRVLGGGFGCPGCGAAAGGGYRGLGDPEPRAHPPGSIRTARPGSALCCKA